MFVHKMQHQKKSIRLKTAQKLFEHIETDFKHMYGSLRQLELKELRNNLALKNLQELQMIDQLAPLMEKKGAKTAVTEHTV